jgi:hypothetical protein
LFAFSNSFYPTAAAPFFVMVFVEMFFLFFLPKESD